MEMDDILDWAVCRLSIKDQEIDRLNAKYKELANRFEAYRETRIQELKEGQHVD